MVKICNRKYKRIDDILYNDRYHIRYNSTYLNSKNEIFSEDMERIKISRGMDTKISKLCNPRYLFMSLCVNRNKREVQFDIYNSESRRYKWEIKDGYIINNGRYLNIENNELIMSKMKCKWEIINDNIRNIEKDMYITSDIKYKIKLTNKVDEANKFYIDDCAIHYIKPKIRVDFEYNNLKNKVSQTKIQLLKYYQVLHNKTQNIGILLAGGKGIRFNERILKQLYKIKSKPIIRYSIEIMLKTLDKIIIVSNTKCVKEIEKIKNQYNAKEREKIKIVINDIDCRLESINKGLEYIKDNYEKETLNVLIHDSARPFIKKEHIMKLLESNITYNYSQYCLKLVNGLLEKNKIIPNRDDYIELCTPFCINFDIGYFIFKNYIVKDNRITYEFIPILDILKIDYNLIFGSQRDLRKITTITDIY